MPTSAPSSVPTVLPSCIPTGQPSSAPSALPSVLPSGVPRADPSSVPSGDPTSMPTSAPSKRPSRTPTLQPSLLPTRKPTPLPTPTPTLTPTTPPSRKPFLGSTESPTTSPTLTPTLSPTLVPTTNPTLSLTGQWILRTQSLLGDVSVAADPAYTLLYSELVVEDAVIRGGCEEWSIFSSLLSQVTYSPKKSVNLTLYAVNSLAAELSDTAVSCTDEDALLNITYAAVTKSVESTSVICHSVEWNVFRCGGYVTICVGCSPSCTADFQCSDNLLSISGCGSNMCSSTTDLGLARFLHLQLADKSPPPSTLNQREAVTQSSISINMELSSGGFVYCLASRLSGTDNKSVTTNVVKLQGKVGAIHLSGGAFTTALTLNNLIPSTPYYIYCLTVSLDGVEMTAAAMRKKASIVQTSCCKTIAVNVRETSAKQGVDMFSAVSIVFDSAPTVDIVLFLRCIRKNDGEYVYPFFSRAIELQSSSLTLEYNIGFIGNNDPGIYLLDFMIAGDSGAEYSLSTGAVAEITVLEAHAEPLPPKLKSATLSNDGVSVSIDFDASTDRASLLDIFKCADLFTFRSANSSKCQWMDSSRVLAYISGEHSSNVGDVVELAPAKLKAHCPISADCSSWTYAVVTSVTISAPSKPIVPVVIISSPAIIGECDDLTLDLSGSSGSGGRQWKSVQFEVQSSSSNASKIESYLNKNYHITPPGSIPRQLLSASFSYIFTATLCNFMGACSSTTARVAVSSNVIPIVSLVGSQHVTINRKDKLRLTATAYFSTCRGGKSMANLDFYWNFYSTEGALAGSDFQSTSVDPKKFQLEPNILVVDHFYYAKITVLHRVSLQASSVTATVYVAQSNIVASISGGSEQSIKLGGTLRIDGSGSYDADTHTHTALTFSWRCIQISPTYNQACPLAGDFVSSLPFIDITATESASGTIARITMSVSDATRHVDQQMDVVTIPPNSPTVLITSEVSKINPSSKLKLSGQVTMESSGTVSWSTSGSSVDLAKVSLVPILTTIDGITSPTTRLFNLMLVANGLPERSIFTFRLTCVLNTGQSSSAAITISTNGPPLGGVLTVLPPDGFMLETVFQMLTTRWVDDDMPLTYEFGYYAVGGTLMVLQSQSLKSYTTSTLPAGKDTAGFKVSTVVQVFDSLSANSTVSAAVVVQAVLISTDDLSDMFDETSVEDVDETKKALSTTTSTINAANCTGAPDCEALNRLPCNSVSRTCGVCSEGYVGASGDANTKCVRIPRDKRKLQATAGNFAADVCSIDSDCSDTTWTSCVEGICTKLSQTCPQNCSGNGMCLFRDSRNYYNIKFCAQGDTTCEGYCLCSIGFAGRSCSITDMELNKRKSLRVKLLKALKNITTSEDASVNSITSWISMLSAVVQHVDELSVPILVSIYDISEFILIETEEHLMPYDTLLILFDVSNALAVAERELSAQDALEYASLRGGRKGSSLVNLLAKRVAGDMVAGQGTVSSIQSAMRMSVLRTHPTVSNITLSAPQTPLEKITGLVVGSVAMHLDSASTATLVDTDAGRWNATSTLLSNPLKLSVTSLGTRGGGARTVIIVLQNHVTQEYSDHVDNVTVSTTCRYGVMEVVTHTCPSGIVLSHNCTGVGSTIIEQCPTVSRRPHCGVVGRDAHLINNEDDGGGDSDEFSSCEVMSFTATNTTCLCRLAIIVNQAAGSKDQLLEKLEEVEVVALTTYIGSSFGSTLAESDEITLAGVRDSLMVIYMYGTLW